MSTIAIEQVRTEVDLVATSPIVLSKFAKMVVGEKVDEDGVELFEGVSKRLVLWPHQCEVLHALMRRRMIVIVKARQLGITWVLAIYALWYAMTHPGSNVMIVSIGEREAKAVIRRILWLYNSLPAAIRAAYPMPRKTAEQLEFTHVSGSALIQSIPSGNAAGRGETVDVLMMDEGAHWEDAETRLASLLPTSGDIGQTIFASTAKGLGGSLYEKYMGAPANGWHRLFHNALARPDRTPEWVEAKRRDLGPLGPQEYPLTDDEAFIASGKSVFSIQTLRWYAANSVRPAIWRGRFELNARVVEPQDDQWGGWQVWNWPVTGRDYLVTADVCGGEGANDWSYASVWDVVSADQLAAFHGKIETEEYARQLVRAGWIWRNTPGLPGLLAPEVNEHGRAVMALLREWRYPNVWVQKRFDQTRSDRSTEYGWHTTPGTRPIMLSALQESLRHRILGIRDAEVLSEMQTFVHNPKKNNKQEALEGHHDDRVMTVGIAAVLLQRLASGVRRYEPEVVNDYIEEGDDVWTPVDPRTGY